MELTTEALVESFLPKAADNRRYVILALDRKESCPMAYGLDLCKSTDHKHECVTRIGFEAACEYVAHMRKSGWEVKFMDRVY